MAAVSTGFVGAVRFNFLAEEQTQREEAAFRQHLLNPQRCYSPVQLDSEKDSPELFTAHLWPPAGEQPPLWLPQAANPTDLRPSRPVSRHKLLVLRSPSRPRPEWMLGWRLDRADDRGREESAGPRLSQPSTRCEDWSTLRQLLPSRGRPEHSGRHQRGWEAGSNPAPAMTDRPATSFPRLRSEMTRYCDAMFVNDKEFWNR